MIKLSYFVRRNPAMPQEQFHAHWRENHAALIKKHAATFGIQRYVQFHADMDPRIQPGGTSTSPPSYDGVAELWFQSREHMDSWFHNQTPEARAAGKEIRDDERRFIDRANSPFFVGEEVVIIEGG